MDKESERFGERSRLALCLSRAVDAPPLRLPIAPAEEWAEPARASQSAEMTCPQSLAESNLPWQQSRPACRLAAVRPRLFPDVARTLRQTSSAQRRSWRRGIAVLPHRLRGS